MIKNFYNIYFLKTGIFLFVFFSFNLFSAPVKQNQVVSSIQIDSLQNTLLTTKNDTTRAAVYVALSEELYLSNIDTVLPLCFLAIEIADRSFSKSTSIEKKSFLLTKANALNNIGYVYKQQGNLTKALEWYNKSLKIREQIGDNHGIANSINNIARIYNIQGDNQKAMEYYNKSLKIQNEHGDIQGASISLNNIGFIYYNQGDINKALEYYNRGLRIQEEIGDKQGVAVSLNSIGSVYSSQGNFPKALECYRKSLQILENIGDKNGIGILHISLGDLYKNQGISFYKASMKEEYFSKALEFYTKSLEMRLEIGDKSGVASSMNSIGFIYNIEAEREQDSDSAVIKFNKALEWNQKCLKLWEEVRDKKGISNSLNIIGGIYLKLADFPSERNNAENLLKEAEKYCAQSLQIAKQLDFPEHIRNASERLSLIYKTIGKNAYLSGKMGVSADNYKSAMEMQDLYKLTTDRINNVEAQKALLKKQLQIEFKKKEKESKALQNKKDAITKEEKERQIFYLWLIGTGLFLVIVFTLFIYRNYRQNQRLSIELEKLSIVASETDNGVIICGPKGTLEWINAGMVRLLGYTLEEWKEQGSTLQEISYNPDIGEKVNFSINNKQTVSYESLNFTKDGRKLWVQSTLTPILNEKGNIKKLVVIDTDITERKHDENIIQEKNREITDSIYSAKRIQHALLASDTLLKKQLPEHFILYKPKDIVSGDFYWAHMIDNKFVMITADCTGHGIPGAFMSLLNIAYLNEAINEKRINSPEKILEYVRSQIINSLNPEGSEVESRDGMDAVLCVYDFKGLWLRFAGANNPLWVIRNNELIKFKTDKMPVGMHHGEEKAFTAHTLGLRKGDIVYTFTDGYADQFGGPSGKKFKYKALKELLLSIQQKTMEEQKIVLNSTFEKWRGNLEQVDDVLVIGIRI